MEAATAYKADPTKVRKTPGKMIVTIGNWKEIDGTDYFMIAATCKPGDAAIRKAMEGLEPGKYVAITGRERQINYTETKIKTITIG